MLDPSLIGKNGINPDAARRAEKYLDVMVSAGSYTDSLGVPLLRRSVANFLHERDGVPLPDINDIFMTEGASQGVHMVLSSLITDRNDGIMIPIPQYPLYSAATCLYGGSAVPYYLNEEDWQLDEAELQQAYDKGKKEGKNIKCLVVINPGNPTGAIFSEETIQKIIRFATKNRVLLIADEVPIKSIAGLPREHL